MKQCTYNTSGATVGTGNYPLTNVSPDTTPSGIQIWLDGEDRTATIGDQHQLGAPHYQANSDTWGTGSGDWHTKRLDLSNAVDWGVGEHSIEFKETGGTGGRLLYYLYVVHPAEESIPFANETCGQPESIKLTNGSGTVKATTEDMLGENRALDDLAPEGCGGGDGPDLVYSVVLGERSVVTATIQSVFTPRIYLLSDPCVDQTTVGCGTTALETDELDPGTYYLVVDADAADQKGDFILNVNVVSAPLPENDICDNAVSIDAGPNPVNVSGTTLYALDQYSGTCGGEGGADVVYLFEATNANDDLAVTFTGGFDSRLFLRAQDCTGGFQVSCSATGQLNAQGLPPGIYYLFVDGSGKPEEGPFSLNLVLN